MAYEGTKLHGFDPRDVAAVDLVEARMPPAGIVLLAHQPVLRLLVGVQGALMRHIGGARAGHSRRREQRRAERLEQTSGFHDSLP